MFRDLERNKEMIEGSYIKLKSYYHYNKNIIFMKQKIADFEYKQVEMEKKIELLANVLKDPSLYEKDIQGWIDGISYYVLPKAFQSKRMNDIVQAAISVNESVCKVNFFIDMPIELHILDTLWTTILGKIVHDEQILSASCYGNCLDEYVLYNKSDDFLESINFKKRKLFKIYYNQYCNWKYDILNVAQKNADSNTIMVSLDVKNFYYSVKWKFESLYNIIANHVVLNQLIPLTNIISEIYNVYTMKLAKERVIIQDAYNGESVLPIGLFSSMLLANIYMAEYDARMRNNNSIIYYGRYVDDIQILLNIGNGTFGGSAEEIDYYLAESNGILDKKDSFYCLNSMENLCVQKEKLKIIFLEKYKSKIMLKKMQKTIHYPSQMDIIPEEELKLEDFEEGAYIIKGFNEQSKFRELSNIEIDGFQLARHMSFLVRMSKYDDINLANKDRAYLQNEGKRIKHFFKGSNALKYYTNWINGFYFFLLIDKNARDWKAYRDNINAAIDALTINHMEDIHNTRSLTLKKAIKRDLKRILEICMATSLALNPMVVDDSNKYVRDLAIKLRHANLFNHFLVSNPLVNYFDDLPDSVDLTNEKIFWDEYKQKTINESRKILFSPRFIHLDELFNYVYVKNIFRNRNFLLDRPQRTASDTIKNIIEYFCRINDIYISGEIDYELDAENTQVGNGYNLQRITFGGVEKSVIKVAIANVKLDLERCMVGLPLSNGFKLSRRDFLDFLIKSYEAKVNYILFPEFYLPFKWIPDVLTYVRKTGITVISGLQYAVSDVAAYNNVAVFGSFKSGGIKKYNNACMILREKNDYAPLEKEILALNGLECKDQEQPCYQIFSQNGIKYGLFLCYEFTDIVARALYKNEIDLIFTPENNKDTTYFSNIIESTTRDLHAFIVQANTSQYGDSRIIGPYNRNMRNIVQIKGGDKDAIIIGTIDIGNVKQYQDKEIKEMQDKLMRYRNLSEPKRKTKYKEEYSEKGKGKEPCKMSARFQKHE